MSLTATAYTIGAAVSAQAQPESSPASGTTWAVIIGMDYNWSPGNRLHFTLADAHRFQQFLHAPDGHVVFLTDNADDPTTPRATRENILKAVARTAAKAGPNDTFWFYFSGHGQFLPASESSFLIPADMRTLTAETGLSVRDLRAEIADPTVCHARARILVLDACESGSSRLWHESASPPRAYSPLAGVITFAAARPDRAAWETDQEPVGGGIFTYYLCCGLAGATDGASTEHPAVSLDALQRYVIGHVDSLCDQLGHPRQEPVFLASSEAGASSAASADWARITVGRYDPDALGQLKPEHKIDAGSLHERPRLEPGAILIVEADDPVLRDSAQTALQAALLRKGIALYSGEIAPEFLAALRDPKQTSAGLAAARRLSARLLLRVHVTPTTAPSAVLEGITIARVTLHAEVTDVYGETKAAADAEAGPTPTSDSPLIVRQTLEQQIQTAIAGLLKNAELNSILPMKRP